MLSLVLLSFALVVQSIPAGAGGADDGCALVPVDAYSVPIHVGGLFLVMAVSSLGLFGSLLMGRKENAMVKNVFELLKMFGIGIIAATAWIHLLPDAFSKFGNPCLQGDWTAYGSNYVGLFGLIGAFLVQLIEASAMSRVHSHSGIDIALETTPIKTLSDHHGHGTHDTIINVTEPVTCQGDRFEQHQVVGNMVTTAILEAGILVHSVVIGLTLGVASNFDFAPLLVAICMHQLFEGLALGVIISKTSFSWFSKFGLSLLYPLTTPLGIGIGIGVKNFYNENSQDMIVAQGILDSLSAGILMYTAYCELMAGEMNHNPIFLSYSRPFKVGCYLMMYLGAASMAIVGIWA